MKRNIKILITVVVALIVVIFIWNQKEARGELKIGVIAPLTALSSAGGNLGENYINGVKLALADYLKAHPDKKIEIVIEDDGYDSKKGITAYKKLTSIDNVDAIINLSSPTVDAVSEQIHAWNKPWVQLGEESAPADDNIVGLFPGQKPAITAVAKQAETDGIKKVVIVTQQISAYERFIEGFDEGFSGEIEIIRINPAEKEMRQYALKVLEAKPEAVVIFMGSAEAANLVKRLSEQSSDMPPIYFGLELQFGLEDLRKVLGSLDLIEGSKGAYLVTDTSEEFKKAYKETYGQDTGMLSDFGYDSLMFLMNSYDTDTDLKNTSLNGVSGKISLDEVGNRLPDYKIVTVVNGELK